VDSLNKDQMTPLMLAAYLYLILVRFSGHDEVLLILLNAGADVNHEDSHGNTSLHYVSKNGENSDLF
jgi:ankyrin repeat protein